MPTNWRRNQVSWNSTELQRLVSLNWLGARNSCYTGTTYSQFTILIVDVYLWKIFWYVLVYKISTKPSCFIALSITWFVTLFSTPMCFLPFFQPLRQIHFKSFFGTRYVMWKYRNILNTLVTEALNQGIWQK